MNKEQSVVVNVDDQPAQVLDRRLEVTLPRLGLLMLVCLRRRVREDLVGLVQRQRSRRCQHNLKQRARLGRITALGQDLLVGTRHLGRDLPCQRLHIDSSAVQAQTGQDDVHCQPGRYVLVPLALRLVAFFWQ